MFILIGIIIIIKYILGGKSKQNIDKSLLETDDYIDNNQDKKEKDNYMSEMFSNKGSIFLMIGLFLLFIAIIIYISFRRTF